MAWRRRAVLIEHILGCALDRASSRPGGVGAGLNLSHGTDPTPSQQSRLKRQRRHRFLANSAGSPQVRQISRKRLNGVGDNRWWPAATKVNSRCRRPMGRSRSTRLSRWATRPTSKSASRSARSMPTGRTKPDVVAPDERILSCNSHWRSGDGSHYLFEGGTSMAPPHVSGLLAAFLSVR